MLYIKLDRVNLKEKNSSVSSCNNESKLNIHITT
jgi:hypothetical protein